MNRAATTEELTSLIAAHAAEIAALKAENETLAQRVIHLEEQLRLERLHRYAPRSEKLKDRIFNEAEQAAAEGEEGNDAEAAAVADTGLPDAGQPEPKKRGRRPLPEGLPRERVEGLQLEGVRREGQVGQELPASAGRGRPRPHPHHPARKPRSGRPHPRQNQHRPQRR